MALAASSASTIATSTHTTHTTNAASIASPTTTLLHIIASTPAGGSTSTPQRKKAAWPGQHRTADQVSCGQRQPQPSLGHKTCPTFGNAVVSSSSARVLIASNGTLSKNNIRNHRINHRINHSICLFRCLPLLLLYLLLLLLLPQFPLATHILSTSLALIKNQKINGKTTIPTKRSTSAS